MLTWFCVFFTGAVAVGRIEAQSVSTRPKIAYKEEKLFDLCGTPGIDMDPTGKNSAIRLVADQPRKRIRSKCTFNVTANNSDGVVISLKTNKLRTAKIVDDICIDYIEFSADSGKTHITVCGEGIKSYETSVPLNVSVYLNPTVTYEQDSLFSLVLTSFNKTTQEVCKGDSFTCLNSRCIWNGFSCDGKNNCGDDSDEKYFVNSMCIMPMAALVLIVTGISVIVTSLLMICYCMMRLRTTIQKNMEEERANRARKKDSFSEGPYSEFVDTYGSQLPKPPLMSGAFQPSGDHTTGPYTRRSSTFPRRSSTKGRSEVSLYRRPYE